MVRGIHSRIFHEPGFPRERNRDIFPLPLISSSGEVESRVSHAVKRRVRKKIFCMGRVNQAISALNSLYLGDASGDHVHYVEDLGCLPLLQQEALRGIIRKVNAFGGPPPEACCSGALKALRAACDGYVEPEAGVGVVVPINLQKLSLPSGNVAGVDLSAVLEEPLLSMVCKYEDWMLADAAEWNAVSEQARQVCTYNDPMIKTKKGYIDFLCHLKRCGILSLASCCRGRVGAFAVSKKPKLTNGQLVERQRLILDCRSVNMMFKEPPHTRLGSLAAMTELELGDDNTMYVAGSDIQDCFYAAKLPAGLEEFFCLQSNLTRQEALRVFGDELDEFPDLQQFIRCINVLPMGFSWSFYIIQQLHEQATIRALQCKAEDLVKDGCPAPNLSGDAVIGMPYCDNVHAVSLSRQGATDGKDRICKELRAMGFTMREDEEGSSTFRTLGGMIDGECGTISMTSSRAWNCIFAFRYLLNAKVSGKLVQQLLGHAVVVSVLNRAGMSIFRHLYDFVHDPVHPRQLRPSERRGVEIFIGLVPLLHGDLRKHWPPKVFCTDASPFGYGVVSKDFSIADVQEIGRWQERWRYKRLDPSKWKPRERIAGLDALKDFDTARAGVYAPDIYEKYEVDEDFPEVPLKHLVPSQWNTTLMGRWRDTSEHITLKEGRALVLAVRRLTRSQNSRRKKHLFLVDNMGLALAVCKGRASNYGMLRIMQQLSALSIAGDICIRVRWIASEFNIADGPSRGQILPGPYSGFSAKIGPNVEETIPKSSSWSESSQWSEGAIQSSSSDEALREGSHTNEEQEEGHCEQVSEGPKEIFKKTGHQPIVAGPRSGNVSEEEQDDYVGKEISDPSNRFTVWKLLPEVSEFLQGSRPRVTTTFEHRHKCGGLHGSSFPGGPSHERRRKAGSKHGISQPKVERSFDQKPEGPKGVEKRKTTRKQGPPAQVDCLRDCYEVSGCRKKRTSFEGSVGLRRVHASRRKCSGGQSHLDIS